MGGGPIPINSESQGGFTGQHPSNKFGDTQLPGLGYSVGEATRVGPIDIKTGTPGSIQSSNPAADALLASAMDFLNQSGPLRDQFVNRANNFMSGNLDVTQSPMYGALKLAADQQYRNARENILASIPQGGALGEALAQNEFDLARTMTAGTGQLAQDELNRAYSIASGAPQLAFSGMGGAASAQAAQAQARAQERGATIQGKGNIWGGAMRGMGSMMGGK